MALVNQAKLDASEIGFTTRFNEVLMAVDDPARALGMEVPSTTSTEDHDWLGSVPGLSEWIDDRKINELRAETVRIKNKDYSSAIRIRMNDINDDRLGVIRPKVDMLARKAALHYGDLLVQALVAGFNTGSAFGTCYDGVAFFSTSHTEGNSGTQSNKGTAVLSETSYFAARAQQWSLKDGAGDPLGIVGNTLVVGPSNEKVARKIVEASLTTGGETNVAAGLANILISPRLVGAYANYWFLADLTQPVRPLILQVREPITSSYVGETAAPGGSKTERAFMRKELLFGAEGRHAAGYGLWQLIFGSDGTV